MQGLCRDEALLQQQDGWCVAGGELLEVMDGECGMGLCSSIRWLMSLLEMMDGEC